MQFYGTVIGALAEAVVYRDIMQRVFGCCDAQGYTQGEVLPASGCGCQIVLGEDGWVDIGGKAVSTMAVVFTNFSQALDDNVAFKWWVIFLSVTVALWIPLRRLIPKATRRFTPDLVMLHTIRPARTVPSLLGCRCSGVSDLRHHRMYGIYSVCLQCTGSGSTSSSSFQGGTNIPTSS